MSAALDAGDTVLRDARSEVAASSPADRETAWHDFAVVMHEWDEFIQNRLTARADMLACAYLLGRGMAECYWALGPDDAQWCADGRTPSAGAWRFLLGPQRRSELCRLVGRIAPYLNPLTPAAVAGSIQAWGCVADNPRWHAQPASAVALYEQERRWYQLLVLGQDPSTLVRPYASLRGWRTTSRALREFWPHLLLAVLGTGLFVAFLVLLTTGAGSTLGKTLLGVIGGVGVSAATVISRLHNVTQTLLTRLRQDVYSDLVAIEITAAPAYPDERRSLLRRRTAARRIVTRAVSSRPLTLATPQPSTPTTTP